MSLNFNQILHQMRFKLLKSIAPTNNTLPVTLSNSDQLTKTSFLKRKIQAIYKSRSNDIKFTAGIGSVLNGSWFSKRTDPVGLFHRKKFLLAGFTLLFISLPIAYLSLKNAPPTAAAWFDDSWAYRKAVSIPSHTTAENNVYVTVPAFDATDTNKFQADCGDLRFTKQNGELLPYYVVDCDATATVHVQFDTLPAGASTYFMYYGNPTADNGFSSADFSAAASGLGSQTLASEEQSQGPVAYWKFDEGYGTNAQDSTQNNNDGSVSGATWQTEDQCISGKCLYFDGSNDVVTVSNTVSGIKTVSFWVKPITTSEQFIDLNGSAYIQASSGTITATNFIDPTIYVDGQVSSVIVANKWQYVTVTTGTTLSGSAIKIGQISTNYGQGFVDDVKIYSYTRTAAQIKSDYASRGSVKGTSAQLSTSKDSSDALSNGLFRYWKMDESVANTCAGGVNDSCDSSGNASNGAWNGDATSATGKFGNGTTYDGTGDYVDIPDYNPGTESFTLAAWFNLSSADSASSNPHAIFGNNQNTPMLGYTPSSKTFTQLRQYSVGSETLTFSATSSNLADSLWHHVVVTIDQQTYKVRLYVDGAFLQEKSIGTEGYTHSNGAFQKIGVGYIPSATTFWKGLIDEVRVYKRVLSGKEVRDLYNWAPGPVAYWNVDEKTGSTANDQSGNGNTGTLASGTTWSTGKYGSGLSFNANYVSTANESNFDFTSDFTISTWINVDPLNNTGYRGVLGKYNASATGWDLGVQSGGVRTILRGTSNIDTGVIGSLGTGTWKYVSIVNSPTSIKTYVDGVLVNTTTGTWTSATNNVALTLGNRDANSYTTGFMGKLDDVRIYNYARTNKQIVEDMNAGHPVGSSPVGSQRLYLKLDEGYGTAPKDSSPYGLNGTMNGSISWSNDGKFGKALDFDGSTGYISFATQPVNWSSRNRTISMWVRPESSDLTGVHDLLAGYDTNYTYSRMRLRYNSAKINFQYIVYPTPITVTMTSSTTLTAGNWYYVTVTWDDTKYYLYINGKQEGTYSDSSVTTDNVTLTTIGSNQDTGDPATYSYGLIDEVKIYYAALTEDEIKLDMNQGSAMVLGTLSDTSGLTGGSIASTSASAQYCVPGDTISCATPVGEWKMDEKTGTNVYDTSGNGKTLTIYNNPAWTQGKVGGALRFSGSGNQYAGIADSGTTSLDINGNLTVEAWVYWNQFKDYGVIVEKGNGGSVASMNYAIWSYSNRVTCYIANGSSSNSISISSSYISTGAWHHIACVANGSQLIPYLDGKAYPAATQTITPTANDNLFSISEPSYVIDGKIDHVKLFNYARTPAQIAWDYNRGGPVGWWKMDECQGIVANDASGNSNSGTITIGATGTQSVLGTCSVGVGSTAAWGNGSVGKYNSSLNFDGTDDYATVPDTNATDPTTAWTLSAWAKRAAIGTDHSIIEKYDWLASKGNYFMRVTSGNLLLAGTVSGTSSDNCGTTLTQINSGAWYHLVTSFDSTTNTIKCYVNGNLEATNTNATLDPPGSDTTLKIGCRGNDCGTKMNGQIDDARVYNYALTPTQVKSLYNENSSVRFGQ